ncbi:hypothetical protein [Salana multivorans]
MDTLLTEYGGAILRGTGLSLQLAAIGFLGAMVLGTVLATFRVSPIPPLRAFGAVYLEYSLGESGRAGK